LPDIVNLRDETTGQTFGVPLDKVAAYRAQGFRPETEGETTQRVTDETFREEYGGAGGAIGAGVIGGLSGLTLGASDQALGALGADRALRHLEDQHSIASGVGQFVGALAPTILTGGAAAGEEAAGIGARILAHSPAAMAGKVGHAVSGLGEGAGLVGRTIAGTAGAAAEGALYGGGQYLTETALQDKPLSAEGFVAGMGHGALFAAPIGATGTLASATLRSAASLFPRSEVSAAAAAGVKEQASSALAQTMRDGDAMVQAAERKLSDIDAGTGIAQTGETATRRVFGAADPQAIADQVTGATARQEVAQALEGYQQARQKLEDWIATEADPDLEKALSGLTPGELQTPALGVPRVPVGEFGAPGKGGFKSQDTLARLASGTDAEGGAAAADLAPADATGAGGPRALRAQGTPAGGVPAQEIVARGMADEPGTMAGNFDRNLKAADARRASLALSEQPGTAVGKRPGAASLELSVDSMGVDGLREELRELTKQVIGPIGSGPLLAEGTPEFAAADARRDAIIKRIHALEDTRKPTAPEPPESPPSAPLKVASEPKHPLDDPAFNKSNANWDAYVNDFNTSVWFTNPADYTKRFRPLNGRDFKAMKEDAWEDLSRDERRALHRQTTNDAYDINKALHAGTMTPEIERHAAALDAAIAKHPAPRDLRVFRGIHEADDFGKRLAEMKPGEALDNPAYSSTSADPSTARAIGETHLDDDGQAIMMTIDVPKGYPIAPIQGDSPGERELLLGRGTRLRLISNEIKSDGVNSLGDKLKPERVMHFVVEPSPGDIVASKFTVAKRSAGGTQGGRWFQDSTGEHWFGKDYGGNSDRVEVEHLANRIYRLFGHSAPETEVADIGGRRTMMSKEIKGELAASPRDLLKTDAKDGFIVDAWLANWDVLGQDLDNMLVSGGKAHRVDNGGSMIFRAQGEARNFAAPVGELESMRSAKSSAGRVFGDLTKQDVERQLTDFAAKYDQLKPAIDRMIDESGLSANAAKPIRQGLAERAQWLKEEAAKIGARPGDDDLLAALAGTKGALDRGESFTAVGRAPAAETRAAQKARATDAAEHFRAKAIAEREGRAVAVSAGEERNPFHESPTSDRMRQDLTQRARNVGRYSIRPPEEPEVGDATMGRILAKHGLAEPTTALESEAGDATMARILAKHGLNDTIAPPKAAAAEPDSLAARILGNEARPNSIAPAARVSDTAVRGEGVLPGPVTKEEIAAQRSWAKSVAPEQRAAKAIMRHNGKGADMGPRLAREAKVIGDMEAANARLADALGSEAPPTAAANAKDFHAATGKAQERAAASSAKLGADLQNKVPAMAGGTDATMIDDDVAKALRKHESRAAARAEAASPAPGAAGATAVGFGGKAADVGSALEVMRAIGMHVPAISHIPVIGPILGLWLKARAVMGILGRKGGSIGKSTEGLIASKAAAVQDRISAATGALLKVGARAAGEASHLAGPAALLAGSLFPGGEKPKSDKPRDLFEARSDDITRAMQPGAIDQAIAQRYPTSDPAMHDAIVAQIQRGIAFLDSKRPKQTVLPGVLPGDGTWKPSAAAIEEFGKYVHAVNDPVSVLEDLAKGHPSAEGAETLRIVYPEIYRYAQKQLLAAAPEMAKTLPYPRRVMLSILYQIPVDGTMQPSHAQFLQAPVPAPPAGKPPSTGPLRLGQQTMSPLDQRAAGA
jgi:hypothetical protein